MPWQLVNGAVARLIIALATAFVTVSGALPDFKASEKKAIAATKAAEAVVKDITVTDVPIGTIISSMVA